MPRLVSHSLAPAIAGADAVPVLSVFIMITGPLTPQPLSTQAESGFLSLSMAESTLQAKLTRHGTTMKTKWGFLARIQRKGPMALRQKRLEPRCTLCCCPGCLCIGAGWISQCWAGPADMGGICLIVARSVRLWMVYKRSLCQDTSNLQRS